MQIIEDWWRHNGVWDREQASGIKYNHELSEYLTITDNWWDGLSDDEKKEIYEDFFNEC